MMFGQWRIASIKLGLNDIKTELGYEGWVSIDGGPVPLLSDDINKVYQWSANNNHHYNNSGYYYQVKEYSS